MYHKGQFLTPLFFVNFDDLPSCVSATCRLFADDNLLYRIIRSPADQELIQEDLNRLHDWERDWLMAFNPYKCELIRFTKRSNPIHGNYIIHGHTLKVAKSGKYLGATLSDNLSWNQQVDAMTKKTNNSLAFLRRNISGCPRTTKAQCYKSLVRPTLEYSSSVWDPHTQKKHQGTRGSTTMSCSLCCWRLSIYQ